MAKRRKGPGVVAVVGSRSPLGQGLLERLEGDPSVTRVVAVDLRPPGTLGPKTRFVRLDLTHAQAQRQLAAALEAEGVEALAHLALLGSPLANEAYARELEVGGTARVLEAAGEAGVEQVALRSTTAVYGAAKHPALLDEDAPLAPNDAAFLTHKREAEALARRFAEAHPEARVAILRFAPEIGPRSDNLFRRYLTAQVAPVLAGHDPIVQVLHEEDAAEAIWHVLTHGIAGLFNVAPAGALPLSAALDVLGSRPLPIPSPVAMASTRALRSLGVLPSWREPLLDFLRYPVVADGDRFRSRGFTFQHDVVTALQTTRSP